MTKEKIHKIIEGKDIESDIDLDELKLKAQQRSLSEDDIQNILNYLLNKK